MVGVINGHASGFGNFQAKAEGIALASTASGPSQPTVRPYLPSLVRFWLISENPFLQASLNPPQSKAPVPVGAIVGATIGALLFIALCLAAVLLCRRRRRNARLEAQLEEMRPDPLIVYEKGALPPEASGSVLSAILREVRSLRRQMGGQSVQPDDPPPKYSVS